MINYCLKKMILSQLQSVDSRCCPSQFNTRIHRNLLAIFNIHNSLKPADSVTGLTVPLCSRTSLTRFHHPGNCHIPSVYLLGHIWLTVNSESYMKKKYEWKDIWAGLHHGSVFEPILYLLYTANIPNLITQR